MAAGPFRYRATVLVLGDLGRSPRMLNHAVALAEDGAEVSLAGYLETAVEGAVSKNPRIRIYGIGRLRRASERAPRWWFLLVTAVRSAWLLLESLWVLLARTPRPDALIVQNPPTVPTLLAAWIAARMRGSTLIVDWHNFGYSMLAARLGSAHAVVRRAKIWERRLGCKANANFCVSAAMREILMKDFGLLDPIVLHDKPRELLPLVPMADRSAAARSVLERNDLALPDGAALGICPTSWTADEDIGLLLRGFERWDSRAAPASRIELLVLITGRGPLRQQFEQRIADTRWRRMLVRTAFFDPADYRHLLCSAQMGFSLHRSSSGVDLPMKIMDLFGARTPACVLDYGPVLEEQIQPGLTALTFRDSQELAARIDQMLDLQFLEQMQRNIEAAYSETWQQLWQRQAAPVFHGAASGKTALKARNSGFF